MSEPNIKSAELFDIRNNAEFWKIVRPSAKLERLATGFRFTEGPVWSDEAGGFLIFSDIPGDQMHRWSRGEGVRLFRKPSHNANGNTRDRSGRLITCEHGSRTLTLTEPDGAVRILADTFAGKRLNSPNDAVVKSDGSIWFTDPPYGLSHGTPQEQPGNYVFRLNSGDPTPGADESRLHIVASDFNMPNGLCFSPDERWLYVADSGKPHHIRVFDVKPDGALGGGGIFCTIDSGVPDGIRVDAEGRVVSSAKDGVHFFSPSGDLIGKILVPETPANLCFGGENRRTLFITAQTSLYAIELKTRGI